MFGALRKDLVRDANWIQSQIRRVRTHLPIVLVGCDISPETADEATDHFTKVRTQRSSYERKRLRALDNAGPSNADVLVNDRERFRRIIRPDANRTLCIRANCFSQLDDIGGCIAVCDVGSLEDRTRVFHATLAGSDASRHSQ